MSIPHLKLNTARANVQGPTKKPPRGIVDHLIQTLTAGAAWEELARLLMAACSGAMMGWERERASKPAGLRTHMLVSLGAAVSVVATLSYVNDTSGDAAEFLRIDPARVIAGVIGGVGFLGAGSIIEARGAVHGRSAQA